MKDLARLYKVAREDLRFSSTGARFKRRKKENERENDLRTSIFGIGNLVPPAKNRVVGCRVVPTKVVGLSRVEQIQEKPKDRRLRRGQANSDLLEAEEGILSIN